MILWAFLRIFSMFVVKFSFVCCCLLRLEHTTRPPGGVLVLKPDFGATQHLNMQSKVFRPQCLQPDFLHTLIRLFGDHEGFYFAPVKRFCHPSWSEAKQANGSTRTAGSLRTQKPSWWTLCLASTLLVSWQVVASCLLQRMQKHREERRWLKASGWHHADRYH